MKTTEIWPIARLVARILHVPGAMAAASAVLAAAAGDWPGALAFAATAVLASGLGVLFDRLIPPGHHANFREAMVGCAAGWLVAALVGALPFLLVAHSLPADGNGAAAVFRSVWNALFESMSGFTTTGLTMVAHPDDLPLGLQWWRSLSQWVGGLGVIVLVLAVVHPDREFAKLFRAEGHERTFGQNVLQTIREIWAVYVGFTCLGAGLLLGLGMPAWDSVNHAMTAISTGGFTVADGGVAVYGTGPHVGVTVLTIAGAVSFVWYQHLLRGEWSRCRADTQVRGLLALLALGALLLWLTRLADGGPGEPLTSALEWTAALTTSGFAATGLEDWSDASKMLLILAMVVGGATGSAAGGVKIARIVTLVTELGVFLRAIVLKPWLLTFRPATLAGELDSETAGRFTVAALFLVMWLGLIGAAGFLLALIAGPGAAITDVMFDAASALSITGLSSGFTSPDMPAGAKAILILLMWMGRLEILPVLVFLAWIAGHGGSAPAGSGARSG